MDINFIRIVFMSASLDTAAAGKMNKNPLFAQANGEKGGFDEGGREKTAFLGSGGSEAAGDPLRAYGGEAAELKAEDP